MKAVSLVGRLLRRSRRREGTTRARERPTGRSRSHAPLPPQKLPLLSFCLFLSLILSRLRSSRFRNVNLTAIFYKYLSVYACDTIKLLFSFVKIMRKKTCIGLYRDSKDFRDDENIFRCSLRAFGWGTQNSFETHSLLERLIVYSDYANEKP